MQILLKLTYFTWFFIRKANKCFEVWTFNKKNQLYLAHSVVQSTEVEASLLAWQFRQSNWIEFLEKTKWNTIAWGEFHEIFWQILNPYHSRVHVGQSKSRANVALLLTYATITRHHMIEMQNFGHTLLLLLLYNAATLAPHSVENLITKKVSQTHAYHSILNAF